MKRAVLKSKKLGSKQAFLNKYTLFFVFVFVSAGAFFLYQSFAASIYYVSPTGNDSNSCTQAAPCASINRAYQLASPGDTITLAGGSYPFQTINFRAGMDNLSPGCDPYGTWGSTSSINCIKITPAAGADVKIRGLYNYASGIWFKGDVIGANPAPAGDPQNFKGRTYNFHISNQDLIGNPPPGADKTGCNCQSAQFRVARPQDTDNASMRPDHVIADGLDSDTAAVYAADNVLLRNMDIGPMWYDTPNPGSSSGAGPDVPRIWGTGTAGAAANIVWDGNYVHEMNRTYDCDLNNACHNDGLYIVGGGPITIRNSAFSQIAAENLFFEYFGGDYEPVHDVLIENNWFGCLVASYPDNPATSRNTCSASKSISFKNCAGTCTNVLVRYNSWYTAPSNNETSASFSNVRFIGNAGAGPAASDKICTQATWTYNAFTSGGCGTNNTVVSGGLSALFKNPAPGFEDFHLLNSTNPANNLVTPTSSDYNLTTDIDGQTRSTPRDAGADEFGSGQTGSANIWVATTGNDSTCARSDSTKPCLSFAKACSLATAGDKIEVKGGTYAKQVLTTANCNPSATVTFQQATGETAMVAGLEVGQGNGGNQPGNLTFKDLHFTGSTTTRAVYLWYGGASAASQVHDITFDGVQMAVSQPTNGPVFEALSGQRITIKNSTIGPACCGNNSSNFNAGSPVGIRFGTANRYPSWAVNSDITIDNNLIQGITRNCSEWLNGYGSCPQQTCTNATDLCHADAIQIWGVNNLSITRNKLYHNEVQGIFIDPTDPNTNGTIANNMIGDVMGGGPAISLNGQGDRGTWNIFNNTVLGDDPISFVWVQSAPAGTMYNVKGNIGSIAANATINGNNCDGGYPAKFSFAYNIWNGLNATPSSCSATDINGTPAFVNTVLAPANTMDLHLISGGGMAQDKIPASTCSALTNVDIDGQARPNGTACDIGADEYNGSTSPLPPPPPPPTKPGDLNSDNQVNILDLSILLTNYNTSNSNSDINKDGIVNILDLSVLLSNYGT